MSSFPRSLLRATQSALLVIGSCSHVSPKAGYQDHTRQFIKYDIERKERKAMKRKYLLCCLSIVPLFSLQGCGGTVIDRETIRGSGSISEETYAFTGITGVQLATSGELDITLGDKEELRILVDDNLLQYFEAGKDGETLKIGTSRGISLRPSRTVRYTLTVKELEFLGLSSSGNAYAPALSADRFEIRISSSGMCQWMASKQTLSMSASAVRAM